MNFRIWRLWFHEEVAHVADWGAPGPDWLDRPKSARGHNLGCWALYRILGGYYP